MVASIYKRKKLNSIISMEAEIIKADNMLTEFLWTRYFIETQGFKVKEAAIYQYNLSTMLLENNEILSSFNCTKHIRVWCFLIRYTIAMGALKVKYFLTGEILSDHFTKPLQGTSFCKFRAKIHGIPEDNPDIDLGLYIPNKMFISIPQEFVVRIGVKIDKSTNSSWE